MIHFIAHHMCGTQLSGVNINKWRLCFFFKCENTAIRIIVQRNQNIFRSITLCFPFIFVFLYFCELFVLPNTRKHVIRHMFRQFGKYTSR